MNLKLKLGLTATMVALTLSPMAAYAQSNRYGQDPRQSSKNEWRNIAIAAGLASVLGLLNKDKTLTFAGGAGALYSLYRYEQDRKSQNRLDRARYEYFSQESFNRDGKWYDRQSVNRNGQRYYQFVCRDERNTGWNNSNSQWNDRDDRWNDRDDRWNDRDGRNDGSWHNGNWGNGNNGSWNDRRNDDRNDDRYRSSSNSKNKSKSKNKKGGWHN